MSESTYRTRPSLLVRIRELHDSEAWQIFTDIYSPLILRYCRFYRVQDADAADISQEVLAKVSRLIEKFEYQPDRGRFRDWLGYVTRSEMVRVMNRAKRAGKAAGGEAQLLLELEPSQPDQAWTDQFHSHILRVALDRIRVEFAQQTWDAFELVWLNDTSAADAAAKLNRPVGLIYMAKSRVLKRLREEIVVLAEDLPIAG